MNESDGGVESMLFLWDWMSSAHTQWGDDAAARIWFSGFGLGETSALRKQNRQEHLKRMASFQTREGSFQLFLASKRTDTVHSEAAGLWMKRGIEYSRQRGKDVRETAPNRVFSIRSPPRLVKMAPFIGGHFYMCTRGKGGIDI